MEETERGKRLVLRARTHLPVARQVGEEFAHFGEIYLARMPAAVVTDEAAHPMLIRLARARTAMLRRERSDRCSDRCSDNHTGRRPIHHAIDPPAIPSGTSHCAMLAIAGNSAYRAPMP